MSIKGDIDYQQSVVIEVVDKKASKHEKYLSTLEIFLIRLIFSLSILLLPRGA